MISPSLLTFSFYRDLEERDYCNKKILQSLLLLNIKNGPKNILELSSAINAINLFFIAEPPEVPVCSEEYFTAARKMLSDGVVDVFEAKLYLNNKLSKYYEGHTLAVALVMADFFSVPVSDAEKAAALRYVISHRGGENHISGFEGEIKQRLLDKCNSLGIEFEFINILLSKRSFFSFFK